MIFIKWFSYISLFWVILFYKKFIYKPTPEDKSNIDYEIFFKKEISFKQYQLYLNHIKENDESTYYVLLSMPAFMAIGLISIVFIVLGIIS